MQLPPELRQTIETLFERAKTGPGSLSTDRTAVHIYGSIGFGCYISPSGDLFMETYDLDSDEPPSVDRSRQAEIAVLILGSRTMPQLAELLPVRAIGAPDCSVCNGTGWTHQEIYRHFGGDGILCQECFGLGWVETPS